MHTIGIFIFSQIVLVTSSADCPDLILISVFGSIIPLWGSITESLKSLCSKADLHSISIEIENSFFSCVSLIFF